MSNKIMSFFLADLIIGITGSCILGSQFGWKVGLGIFLIAWYNKPITGAK